MPKPSYLHLLLEEVNHPPPAMHMSSGDMCIIIDCIKNSLCDYEFESGHRDTSDEVTALAGLVYRIIDHGK